MTAQKTRVVLVFCTNEECGHEEHRPPTSEHHEHKFVALSDDGVVLARSLLTKHYRAKYEMGHEAYPSVSGKHCRIAYQSHFGPGVSYEVRFVEDPLDDEHARAAAEINRANTAATERKRGDRRDHGPL